MQASLNKAPKTVNPVNQNRSMVTKELSPTTLVNAILLGRIIRLTLQRAAELPAIVRLCLAKQLWGVGVLQGGVVWRRGG